MTIRRPTGKPSIDIDGPQGNAYVLMGYASRFGKQLGWDEEEVDAVLEDMRSGNYRHLVEVFDRHFGDLVDLISSTFDDEGSE